MVCEEAVMDNQNDLIQRPTLSIPAYREPKRPLWLMLLGALVMILGLVLVIFAALNFWG
jgi:hypothetical protein